MDTKKQNKQDEEIKNEDMKKEEEKCECECNEQCQCDGDKECSCEGEETKQNEESEKWKNKYVRALADYENLERRTQTDITTAQKKAKAQLLNKFLDVLDTIDQAEIFVKDPGLALVKTNFNKIIQSEGVTELDLLGKEYDPYTAEAIEVVEDTEQANKIVAVMSKGYTLGNDVLRVAKVKVAKTSN